MVTARRVGYKIQVTKLVTDFFPTVKFKILITDTDPAFRGEKKSKNKL